MLGRRTFIAQSSESNLTCTCSIPGECHFLCSDFRDTKKSQDLTVQTHRCVLSHGELRQNTY